MSVQILLPDGEPKLVDGLPFNLASLPDGYEHQWTGGYCAAVGVAAGTSGRMGYNVLWNAGVPVEYAGACLRRGVQPETIAFSWETGLPIEFAVELLTIPG